MTGVVRGAILAAAVLLPATERVRAVAPLLHGIAVEETLDAPPVLAAALPTGSAVLAVPTVVYLSVPASLSAAGLDRLDVRVALYRTRHIPVVLDLGEFPKEDTAIEAWRELVRSIAARERGKVVAYQFGSVPPAGAPAPGPYALLLKQVSIQVRSADPDAQIAQGPIQPSEMDWLARVYAEGVAPYVDVVAVSEPPALGAAGAAGVAGAAGIDAIAAVVTREDPTASMWIGPVALPAQPTAAAEKLIETVLRGAGTRVALTIVRAGATPLRAALTAASRISDLLTGDLLALDAPVHWFRGAAEITSTVPSRLLYSQASADTYLLIGGVTPAIAADVVVDVSMDAPAIRDPITGAIDRLPVPPRTPNTPRRLAVRLASRPIVLDFNYELGTRSSAAEVRQTGLPDVGEIIARHQQAQAAQDAALVNYLAHLRIEQHFHPTPADPAYNLVFENDLFFDRAGAEWAQTSLSINGATWRGNPPSIPLLQPEKVMSLPLELRLNRDYRYRLEGLDTIGGREAFVVRFDPNDASRALYRGTVWIDRTTFVRLRVAAVELHSTGVVSANEEEQVFSPVGEIAGQAIWLATRLTSRQTFLVAGRTILNEREMRLTDVRLNAADFEPRRAEARGGDRVMYRDTDRGVRYLVKKGTTREVSDTLTTSTKALALGADIDPSFDIPLPIAGIDILDFNFLHRDMQLALLFGGVLAIGNVQRAGLWGGRFDASVDFFGLAVKGTDAVFDADSERVAERVRTLPASAGVNLGYRLSPSHKLTTRYELSFAGYSRDPLTDPSFTLPSSTVTTGAGGGYEFRRHGYSFVANGAAYRRKTWTPWGDLAAFDPATRTYTRYDLGLSKDFVLATFQTVHVNGQYFGGARLDRFSQYQFGLFDATRMHGVPSAVRFDELAMFRGSYSFNVFEQYRLDLFFDQAVGHTAAADDRWRPVTGMGIGVNFRGPRGTLIRGDLGRSILPPEYRGVGSTVLQIMILKPL